MSRPDTAIALVTKESSENTAIAALRAGIHNYLRFPSEKEEVIRYLDQHFTKTTRLIRADNGPPGDRFGRLVGESEHARQLKQQLAHVCKIDSNVLITGETGTGKELVAELIHQNSARHQKPFVCINCAALPDTLFESELFGYERGAFTGAMNAYEGKLSLAENGTMFFDEIGDMSLFAQSKILRILEGKPYHRLGGRHPIRANVRFITATNRDVESMMTAGSLRSDLFFRVNVSRIHVAPLRERKQDVSLLLEEMVRAFSRKYKRQISKIPQEVMQLFLKHDWPGNVRELINVIEATFANLACDELRLMDLPPMFLRKVTTVTPRHSEREQFLEALRSSDWNLSKTAKRLSLSRMTIYRKMAKFKISRQDTVTDAGETAKHMSHGKGV